MTFFAQFSIVENQNMKANGGRRTVDNGLGTDTDTHTWAHFIRTTITPARLCVFFFFRYSLLIKLQLWNHRLQKPPKRFQFGVQNCDRECVAHALLRSFVLVRFFFTLLSCYYFPYTHSYFRRFAETHCRAAASLLLIISSVASVSHWENNSTVDERHRIMHLLTGFIFVLRKKNERILNERDGRCWNILVVLRRWITKKNANKLQSDAYF